MVLQGGAGDSTTEGSGHPPGAGWGKPGLFRLGLKYQHLKPYSGGWVGSNLRHPSQQEGRWDCYY